MQQEKAEIQVFHGTDISNFDSIRNKNFQPSEGLEHEKYLGDGAYFFCKGVPPDPIVSAEKWAKTEAWDNENKEYKYSRYCVLEALVKVEKPKFLDLTDWDGIEIFNFLRDKYVRKLWQAGLKLKFNDFKDGHIINEALKDANLEIDVVKGNFFFKFKEERIVNAQFKTPNCTIVAVRNLDCVDKKSIKIHKTNFVK